jgi:hypothetical protein
MKYFATLLLLYYPFLSICQSKLKQETIAIFIITESTINNQDLTAFDIKRGGQFVFYKDTDGDVMLSNVATNDNNQSYGQIIDFKCSTEPASDKYYEATTCTFIWNYQNNYDNKSGYATCKLNKIYKPQGVTFELFIVLSNLDLLKYKGYMKGTLDFSQIK